MLTAVHLTCALRSPSRPPSLQFWQNSKLAGIAIVVNGLFIVLEQFAGMKDFATLHPAFLIGPVSYGIATKALAKSNVSQGPALSCPFWVLSR